MIRDGTGRRSQLVWIGALVTGILLLVAIGPRARVASSFTPPTIPDDLDRIPAYLEGQEARFTDIVPGTEQKVTWMDPTSPARSEFAIVYLHGFSASHRETAPLTEELAEALEANAFLARLTGHARSGEALGAATADDWIDDAAEAVEIGRRIGRRVILLGVSTGGTLATWAAAQPEWSADIAALVLISPNYGVRDRRRWLLTAPWGAWIAKAIVGQEYAFEPENPEHRLYWTERYPVEALTQMAALTETVDARLVSRIEAPTLVFFSPNDRVVDPAEVEATVRAFGSSVTEVVRITETEDSSNHILAGDILSPGTTAPVLARTLLFLDRYSD